MARAKQNTNVSPADASKFRKAGDALGMIEIKIGRNKYEVVNGGGISLDSGDGYAYLSGSFNGVYALNPSLRTATMVDSDAELALALKGIRANAKPTGAAKPNAKDQPTLPTGLMDQIKAAIPQGYKLGADKEGNPTLVKARQRRSPEEIAAAKAAKDAKPPSNRGRKRKEEATA